MFLPRQIPLLAVIIYPPELTCEICDCLQHEELPVMAPDGPPVKFVFVDQSGADTQQALQQSRKRIRQQARLHTISKWKTNRLKSIEIQLVNGPGARAEQAKNKVDVTTSNDDGCRSTRSHIEDGIAARTRTRCIKDDPDGCTSELPAISPPLPVKGYEQARTKYDFDLPWLSALALTHVGRAPTDNNPSIPSFHRTTVHDWINYRETSYLNLIPAYYDSSPLIRDLVDAVLIKLQDVLTPAKVSKGKVLSVYGKALRSVQDALKDDKVMKSPEALCATQIIQLYELLDVGAPEVWIAHTKGMQKLMQVRGPKKFTSRLDRSLLCAELQHIFNQAFMQNKDCFLEQDDWQDLLEDIVSENDQACPPMHVKFWKMIVFLPRLIRQIEEYLLKPGCNLDREILLSQLHVLKRKIAHWRISYLNSASHLTLGPVLWKNLYSVSLGNESIVNRLLISLRPSSKDARILEEEAQALVAEACPLKSGKIMTPTFYLEMIMNATRDEWMAVVAGKPGKVDKVRDVISPNIFVRWNAMMGRHGKYGSFWPETVDRGKVGKR